MIKATTVPDYTGMSNEEKNYFINQHTGRFENWANSQSAQMWLIEMIAMRGGSLRSALDAGQFRWIYDNGGLGSSQAAFVGASSVSYGAAVVELFIKLVKFYDDGFCRSRQTIKP